MPARFAKAIAGRALQSGLFFGLPGRTLILSVNQGLCIAFKPCFKREESIASAPKGNALVLKILIVEDDPHLAAAMSYLIEENGTYQVVGTPNDLASAVTAAESQSPHIALVDLNLAGGSDGFSVALRLGDMGVTCLFVTARPPSFPLPELAIGCLTKPVTGDELHFALSWAEDRIRGRERIRSKMPKNLVSYADLSLIHI